MKKTMRTIRRAALRAFPALAILATLASCENGLLQRISDDVQAARAAGAPTVVATSPAANQGDVATSTVVSATFAAALDPASVTTSSFTLSRGVTAVAGAVSYDDELMRAVFTPAVELDLLTTYTARLTTDIRNAAGTPMAAEYSWAFTTYAANPTEIVVNLSYSGPYTLSADYPIYLRFIPNGLTIGDPDGGLGDSVYAVKRTSQGSTVVSVSDLPASESGSWALEILHDLNGNYDTLGDEDAIDVSVYYLHDGGANMTTDAMDVLVTTWPEPITFDAAALLHPGGAYTVEVRDPPAFPPDAAEPDGSYTQAAVVSSMNVSLTRTLDWGDSDVFSFVPPRTDVYRVAAAQDPVDPDDPATLALPFTVRLGVLVQDPGSDQVYHVQTDYGNDGTSYGLVDATLVGGSTYYFVVSGVKPDDAGDYRLKVVYAPAEPDGYEEDDTPTAAGTVALDFGPAGLQSRTAEKYDVDYMTFTLPASGGLSINVAYAWMIAKPASSVRGELAFRVDLARYGDPSHPESGGTAYGGFVETPFPAVLVTARPQLSGLPNGSLFYLEVQNDSTGSGYYQPTGAYEIALRAGPDNQDYDLHTGANNAPAREAGARDDAWNEPQVQTLSVGFAGEMKSIWPAGDVDWLEVEWPAGVYDNGLVFTMTGPTAGADDLDVQVEFYQGDGSSYVGAWDFGGGTSEYTLLAGLVSRPATLYVKVWRSQYEVEKSTGAYRLEVAAAP